MLTTFSLDLAHFHVIVSTVDFRPIQVALDPEGFTLSKNWSFQHGTDGRGGRFKKQNKKQNKNPLPIKPTCSVLPKPKWHIQNKRKAFCMA